ncbi:hypothetical protein DMA10_18730 [Streptomyces sp. WAC 01420]|nr:hypothetical protein DLM49_26525 [Streptomyces sp. WAC 01438]RSM94414.1 hypothetical protein DMA10_18730 [Streptomyces sp. WAC 01420]
MTSEQVREPEAAPPEPGTRILRVFGRQMKLRRIRAGLERPEAGARRPSSSPGSRAVTAAGPVVSA